MQSASIARLDLHLRQKLSQLFYRHRPFSMPTYVESLQLWNVLKTEQTVPAKSRITDFVFPVYLATDGSLRNASRLTYDVISVLDDSKYSPRQYDGGDVPPYPHDIS